MSTITFKGFFKFVPQLRLVKGGLKVANGIFVTRTRRADGTEEIVEHSVAAWEDRAQHAAGLPKRAYVQITCTLTYKIEQLASGRGVQVAVLTIRDLVKISEHGGSLMPEDIEFIKRYR